MGLHIDPFGENKQKSIEVEKKQPVQDFEKPVKKSNGNSYQNECI